MNAKRRIPRVISNVVITGAALLALAITAYTQVKTQSSTASAAATKTVQIERGTIAYVSGNSVVVKMEDGSLRHFDNVPESTTVTVDGKQLNVHQLTAGMKVERQIITTAIPKVITTVKTVTGTVWQVSPPNSLILTMENGKNQQFTIPKGQKFTVDGREVDAFGLRKGLKINAQQVTEVPETEIVQQVKTTGVMPRPPEPKAGVPVLVVYVPVPATPAPVDAAAAAPVEPAPTQLPRTGSNFPLFGLLGAILICLGLGLKAIRTSKA